MKMKHLLLLSVISVAWASCSKTEDAMQPSGDGSGQRTTSSGNNGVIGPVPSTFTQKALLENFTSAQDSRGADNDLMIRNAISTWPTRVMAASFHINDAMQGSPTFELVGYVNGGNTPSLPGVMQNRRVYGGKLINDDMTWNAYLSGTLGMTPPMGLAIETSVNGNVIQAKVHVGFNSDQSGSWKLITYVTRNSVTGTGPGYDQANISNTNPSSPLYNQGDPIPGYRHNFVVTKLLTPIGGSTIPVVFHTMGGHFVETYHFDVRSSTTTSDLTVVACILDDTDNIILNAQQAIVGTTQNWD